jgi:4-amino-4-deoxy-L-arabinose transferase-like glycosyltransferase
VVLLAATLGWLMLVGVLVGRVRNNLDATLHRDETIAWTYASLPATEIPEALLFDVNPPVYFLALHAWLVGGGGNEQGDYLRALSVLAIVAAAVVAFDAARRVAGRVGAGSLAGAFVLLAPSTVALAGLARPYALAYLLGMVAIHAAILVVQRGGWAPLVLLGASGGLLTLTHYWGGLLLAALMIGLAGTAWLTRRRDVLVHSVAATGLALLALLPWAPTLLSQLGNSPLAAHQSPDVELLGVTLTLSAGGRAASWVLGIAAAGAVAVFVTRYRRRSTPEPSQRDPGRVLLVCITAAAVGIVALLWAVSQVRPLFAPSYAYIVMAPLAVLVGVGMSRRWWTAALVVTALLVPAVPDVANSVRPDEDDRISRGPESMIAERLAQTTADGDVVVTSPGRVLAVRYYLGDDRDYVTPIGRVYDGRFDYRDRVSRLEAVDAQAVARRVADAAEGTRIAFVHDIGEPWDHPYWRALDDAMVTVGETLADTRSLVPVHTTYVPGPLDGIAVRVFEVAGERDVATG